MARYRIKNKQTGETKVIKENELGSYGLTPEGAEGAKITQLARAEDYLSPEDQTVQEPGPVVSALGGLQQKLGQSKALPVAYGAVGGMAAGWPGAAAGGFTGEKMRQWLARGGREAVSRPTRQELGQATKTGAIAGLTDFLAGKAFELGGKAVRGVAKTKPVSAVIKKVDDTVVDKAIKPFWNTIRRKFLAQSVNPTRQQIINDLTDEGVSKTLQEAVDRGVIGPPQLVRRQAIEESSKFSSQIENFLVQNQDDLPNVKLRNIVKMANLDDVAKQYKEDLLDDASARAINEFADDLAKQQVPYDVAYKKMQSWNRLLDRFYRTGKVPENIPGWKMKVFMKLNNAGRQYLKDQAKKSLPGEAGKTWVKIMDDFHFWKTLESMADIGTSEGERAVGSLQHFVFRNLLPTVGGYGAKLGSGIVEQGVKPAMRGVSQATPTALKAFLMGQTLPNYGNQQ